MIDEMKERSATRLESLGERMRKAGHKPLKWHAGKPDYAQATKQRREAVALALEMLHTREALEEMITGRLTQNEKEYCELMGLLRYVETPLNDLAKLVTAMALRSPKDDDIEAVRLQTQEAV